MTCKPMIMTLAPCGSSEAPSTAPSSPRSSNEHDKFIIDEGKRLGSGRRKNPPSRSVSPLNQTAGILIRMGPDSLIDSICVGSLNHPPSPNSSLNYSPHFTHLPLTSTLPPMTRDYGFEYASKGSSILNGIDGVDATLTSSNTAVGQIIPYSPSKQPSTKNTHNRLNRHSSKHVKNSTSKADTFDESSSSSSSTTDENIKRTSSYNAAKLKSGKRTSSNAPRICISCGATKTPYWREAWITSVLLCNACGLRYSKFRRHCIDCSYVPRKEDKGSRSCPKCGGLWS